MKGLVTKSRSRFSLDENIRVAGLYHEGVRSAARSVYAIVANASRRHSIDENNSTPRYDRSTDCMGTGRTSMRMRWAESNAIQAGIPLWVHRFNGEGLFKDNLSVVFDI